MMVNPAGPIRRAPRRPATFQGLSSATVGGRVAGGSGLGLYGGGVGGQVISLVVLGALGYAGFKRGQKIEKTCGKDCSIVWPTIGWGLLGATAGPGYLVGRLSS